MDNRFPSISPSYQGEFPTNQDVQQNAPQYMQQQQSLQITTTLAPGYPQSQAMGGTIQQSSLSSQLPPLTSMMHSPQLSPRKSMAGMISPIGGPQTDPFNNRPTTATSPIRMYHQSPAKLMQSPAYHQSPHNYPSQPTPYLSPSHGYRAPISTQQSHLLMVQNPQSYSRSPQPGYQTQNFPVSPVIQPPYALDHSPMKAVRQLNMQLSPGGSYPVSRSGMMNLPQPMPTMRPEVGIPQVQTALPVLSDDTLDILSDTPETPAISKPSPVEHMQRSPLLQKHLLMPLQSIPTTSSQTPKLKKQDGALSVVIPPSSTSQLSRPPQITEKPSDKNISTFKNINPLKESFVESADNMSQPQDNATASIQEKEISDSKTNNNVPELVPTVQKSEVELSRDKLSEQLKLELQQYEEDFKLILEELFFLQNGGNIMDFSQFRKKPSNKLLEFLKKSSIDSAKKRTRSQRESHDSTSSKDTVASPASSDGAHKKSPVPKRREKKISSDTDSRLTPVPSPLVASKSEQVTSNKNVTVVPVQTPALQKVKRLNPRLAISSSYDESIGSQEEILERAKQEAVIQRKVVELRKQGLWSQKRLPKVQEAPRPKTHWDYLLEEMSWLSADFAQERKWKRAAARKLVRTVANFHKEQEDKKKKAEKEEQMKLRRIASTMAREIKQFWKNIEKVVDYKQQSLLGEKRQKALDIHLNFIVDQTEKYSDWLTQGLHQPAMSNSSASPKASLSGSKHGSDDEFLPQGEASDDEETIAFAEKEIDKDTENELTLLEQESKLPFDELISKLPPEVIENVGKPLEETEISPPPEDGAQDESTSDDKKPEEKEESETEEAEAEAGRPSPISLRRSARKRKSTADDLDDAGEPSVSKKSKTETTKEEKEDASGSDFSDGDLSSSDIEDTVAIEEAHGDVDHEQEIKELEADNDLSVEELMKKYSQAIPDEESMPGTSSQSSTAQEANEEQEKESGSESENEDASSSESASEEEIGMDYLLNKDLSKDDQPAIIQPVESKKPGESSPNKEITDVAAEAASLQPTGTTLATTQVVTPIPILLRHTLREYQHIGLDWLVTMYDKRLNGILADEMGLGKTIQTIALLAHLACEKGVWGPHLIVVPTSVMLNWEMEFKKWCPGFKILTYYGNQKERKLKRTGWTKSNAFHVCITSYKLVLQDHSSFRRKKWKYLVLDEAQNIKNFKSQRWQSLLNFNSQRRLLLTGTPLQNNLMELWSLMHFLMPHVFQSHKEFKEWFSNPLTGMIEGSQEYSESIVRRLHKVLRPFLLRRIKKDVEKQMPNKYEHVVMCHLSKRQRFLYEDFMSRAATKDSLASGHFMSVINILMQLRKVCNHPNLFEPRPIVSPFISESIQYYTASIITKVCDKSPLEAVQLPNLLSMCSRSKVQMQRTKQLKVTGKLIQEISSSTAASPSPQKPRFGVREKLMELMKTETTNYTGQIPLIQKLTNANPKLVSISQTDSSISQPITLQYQTTQGARFSASTNKQIRLLPGGVVQIVPSSTSTPAPVVKSEKQPEAEASPVQNPFRTFQNRQDINKVEIKSSKEYSKLLEDRESADQSYTLQRIAWLNEQRCTESDNWLSVDTISLLESITQEKSVFPIGQSSLVFPQIRKKSYASTLSSTFFTEAVKSHENRLKEMNPVVSRFVLYIPKCLSRCINFHVSHPTPATLHRQQTQTAVIERYLSQSTAPLHTIQSSMVVQFPEARLIQYDCGKLQVLDVLLRRFWKEKHRCLVFTQMTKVLDILEAFLSYHGYRYLRLDGSTKVEQRMALMERFNNDSRIFIFILSTRSGGVGVNLTGADTVIFYDSDWNPTMDAQAQDRCHRIGQTRDVHIYRLISERTVEENILKKANQKRLLGEMAIEGGSFTTAFFKEQALKDLFKEPTGLEELPSEPDQDPPTFSKPITARQKALAAAKEAETKAPNKEEPPKEEEKDFEQALLESEDKEDAAAAKLAKEEQDADMDEFNEAKDDQGESSKVQDELKSIYEELTPIERYALHYLEESTEEINYEELQLAEEQVHEAKKEWELTHLVALKEEEERRLEEQDEIFYTREDASNEIWIDDVTGETMPIWFPPTPPDEATDVYIDVISNLLYKSVPMPDIELSALNIKKERKRLKHADQAHAPKKKVARWDHIPSSLFNRVAHVKKKEKLAKLQAIKRSVEAVAATDSTPVAKDNNLDATQTVPAATTVVVAKETTTGASDWLVTEDWTLLQAVQQVLELPLSLVVMVPAHTPNWDLVADIVNTVSAIYRSAKMCKQRFEQVIAPREDGRAVVETVSTTPKKKSSKAVSKMKIGKGHKTSAMLSSDNNQQQSRLHNNRFTAVKTICSKRAPPSKSNAVNHFQRNPKHTSILLENNICYDKPLSPTEVATLRANRIAREKKLAADQAKQSSNQQPASSTHVQITTNQLPKAVTQALPTSNIIVNPALTAALSRKLNQQNLQQQINNGNKIASTTINTTASLQQTLLRPANQQIQITQGSTVSLPAGTSLHRLATSGITVMTTTAGNLVATPRQTTITLPSQVKLTTQQIQVVTKQRLKPGKTQITPQRVQLTPQQMKQLRFVQQQKQQIVSAGQNKGQASHQFQARPQTATLQDLQLIMNQNFGKSVQRGNKVHIAPILAQEQAHQVQVAAAQQASQNQGSSKPMPITVPVSNIAVNVNIGSTSSPSPRLPTMSLQPSYIIQQQNQIKQRPSNTRQVNLTTAGKPKAVYTMMAQKRKLTATLVPNPTQPAVTVTKLLQKIPQIQGAQIRMPQPSISAPTTGGQSTTRLGTPQPRQTTLNIQQFKQLVSQQQQHSSNVAMTALVTVATPSSVTTATKLTPSMQQQIIVQSQQMQLCKQPIATVQNQPMIPQVVTQATPSSSGVSAIGPTVTINPVSELTQAKPQPQTVQVSVVPDPAINIQTDKMAQPDL